MQVMALRSAKNAGLHVKDETLKKAIKYIKKCERIDQRHGGGLHLPTRLAVPGFARTAAGTCVLFLTGEYKAAEIEPAVNYLKKHFDDQRTHFYYGHYYAAHAMHQWGGTPKGAKDWEDWYKRLEDHFLPPAEPGRQLAPRHRAQRSGAGLSDEHRRHRPVGAGQLFAELHLEVIRPRPSRKRQRRSAGRR